MPIVTVAYWELIHKWGSSDNWEKWTEQMMIDELLELDKVRAEIRPKKTLLEFIDEIKRVRNLDGTIVKVKSRAVDFKSICHIIDVWKHITTTCTHLRREWLAQDESHIVCSKHKDCNRTTVKDCPDYEPMSKVRSIEELIKGEKVVFT